MYGHDSQNKLKYDFRLVCSDEYYGTDCDILCKPRNDNFGHYTCGDQGEKVCLPGWEKKDEAARDDVGMLVRSAVRMAATYRAFLQSSHGDLGCAAAREMLPQAARDMVQGHASASNVV